MIKQIVTSRWDFMRWLRLLIGMFLILIGIVKLDSLPGIVGAFFILQALMNIGCCGVRGCSSGVAASPHSEKDVVGEFEEVRVK